MLDSQLHILRTHSGKYISIGITAGGAPRRSIPVPWKHTCNAFNMRTPDVYLSPADLDDPEIRTLLDRFIVFGCYIFDQLDDCSFIARFPGLEDVFIFEGRCVSDLSFMEKVPEWRQFFLKDARVPTLAPLFSTDMERIITSRCVCFVNCEVDDSSAMEQQNILLSELVIIRPKGSNERNRWTKVHAATRSYYEFE